MRHSTYPASAGSRWVAEPPSRSGRTEFQRDRARVVHSSALRRLGGKTQVVGPGTDDFARTRLTHSLEVAQVGRELANALGCDPDVVDAACLAHDLGHPPFGHHGESVLNELAADYGGFEGNAQTLRLLTRLEPKLVFDDEPAQVQAGLNLTRATLDAVIKYPWRRGEHPAGGAKFGVYEDDLPVFTWIREGSGGARCVESQVMDLADDIAYSVHDVEDAIVGRYFDPASLADAGQRRQVLDMAATYCDRSIDVEAGLVSLMERSFWPHSYVPSRASMAVLKSMTSRLIGRFCMAVQESTRERFGPGPLVRYGGQVLLPATTSAEIAVLKGIARVTVMDHQSRAAIYAEQRDVIAELYQALVDRGAPALESAFAEDWEAADTKAARCRAVVDQIAVLTDHSAHQWHRRWCLGSS